MTQTTQDLARLKRVDGQRAAGLRILETSQAAFANESAERVQQEIDTAIADVRREHPAKSA